MKAEIKAIVWALLICLGIALLLSCHVEAKEKENFEWTGEVGKEVSFAKYIGSRRDFSWNGQIGVNIGILKYRKARLYLAANLETVMDKRFSFRPYDINYTIEPGVKFRGRFGDASFIFHHECHHDVDRHDGMNEMFNIVGIRLESREKDIWGGRKDIDWLWNLDKLASVGYYVGKSDVDYNWDFIAEAELNIVRHKKKVPYVRVVTRIVTQTSERSHFVDYIIEPGVKLRGPNGILSLFCQLWHKHDIDQCNGQTDDFALLGMRYNW